jgi:hypothetical protein
VAHYESGTLRVLCLGGVQHGVQVVQELGEVSGKAPHTIRASVALLIVGVHDATTLGQPGTHGLVTPAVLGVTVDEHHDSLGLGRDPGTPEERAATGDVQMGFGAADSGS